MSKLQLKLVNNEQILSSKKLGKACMFEDTGDCVAPATDYCKYCDYGECTGNAYDYCSSDDFSTCVVSSDVCNVDSPNLRGIL